MPFVETDPVLGPSQFVLVSATPAALFRSSDPSLPASAFSLVRGSPQSGFVQAASPPPLTFTLAPNPPPLSLVQAPAPAAPTSPLTVNSVVFTVNSATLTVNDTTISIWAQAA